MRATVRRLSIIGTILAMPGFGALPAIGDEAAVSGARSVIESQIRAFLAGDDTRAYSYASPGIRRLFPTLESFMDMVTGGYQPVWKPQEFVFGDAFEADATTVIQQVHVVGPDGREYEAIYMLERQADGSWRIAGVSLRARATVGA